jgi:hypothetical protein
VSKFKLPELTPEERDRQKAEAIEKETRLLHQQNISLSQNLELKILRL